MLDPLCSHRAYRRLLTPRQIPPSRLSKQKSDNQLGGLTFSFSLFVTQFVTQVLVGDGNGRHSERMSQNGHLMPRGGSGGPFAPIVTFCCNLVVLC